MEAETDTCRNSSVKAILPEMHQFVKCTYCNPDDSCVAPHSMNCVEISGRRPWSDRGLHGGLLQSETEINWLEKAVVEASDECGRDSEDAVCQQQWRWPSGRILNREKYGLLFCASCEAEALDLTRSCSLYWSESWTGSRDYATHCLSEGPVFGIGSIHRRIKERHRVFRQWLTSFGLLGRGGHRACQKERQRCLQQWTEGKQGAPGDDENSRLLPHPEKSFRMF